MKPGDKFVHFAKEVLRDLEKGRADLTVDTFSHIGDVDQIFGTSGQSSFFVIPLDKIDWNDIEGSKKEILEAHEGKFYKAYLKRSGNKVKHN